jgi:hypothetical protein
MTVANFLWCKQGEIRRSYQSNKQVSFAALKRRLNRTTTLTSQSDFFVVDDGAAACSTPPPSSQQNLGESLGIPNLQAWRETCLIIKQSQIEIHYS